MADNDAPRFGQRSEHWTPDSSGAVPSSGAGETDAGGTGENASSWPQYGQLDHTARTPRPTWGQYQSGSGPSGNAGQTPYTGTNAQSNANPWTQFNGPQPGGPQPMNAAHSYQPGSAGPAGTGAGGYPQPAGTSGPYGVISGLPSRTLAVVLMVLGAVTTVILSVVVFIVLLLSGVNIGVLVEKGETVSNGATVSVDQTGSILVMAQDGESLSCTVSNTNGQETALGLTANAPGLLSANGLTPGEYTLKCRGDVQGLNVITGISTDKLVKSATSAFLWGTVIGLVGIVVFIVGVVKLVRVNRKRRAIQRAAWQQRY